MIFTKISRPGTMMMITKVSLPGTRGCGTAQHAILPWQFQERLSHLISISSVTSTSFPPRHQALNSLPEVTQLELTR